MQKEAFSAIAEEFTATLREEDGEVQVSAIQKLVADRLKNREAATKTLVEKRHEEEAAKRPREERRPPARSPPSAKTPQRFSSSSRCSKCGGLGHDNSRCPTPQKGADGLKCSKCGGDAHLRNACPSK